MSVDDSALTRSMGPQNCHGPLGRSKQTLSAQQLLLLGSGAATAFPDYPKLGDTKDFLLIGVNNFNSSGSYAGPQIKWVGKPAAGTVCPTASAIKLREAMAESDRTLGVIPDRAAKILADRYKACGISPLGMLAANGSVELEGIKGELITYYGNPETTERDGQQLDYLSWCVMETGERGPDPDWPRSPEEHSQ